MKDKRKKHKEEIYLVSVTILEGRHYAWPGMDSYVHTRVGNHVKCTKIRPSTDCPYYNEFYIFEYATKLQNLLDKHVTLTVFRPRKIWRRKKCLGYITLDIATIWQQPDHQFFRKWAVLCSNTSDFSGPRGYLKVTLSILAKGESPKVLVEDPSVEDEIEGNLLLPDGITLERQKCQYIFKVYHGDDLSKDSSFIKNTRKHEKHITKANVQVTFAGLMAKTSIQKHSSNPIWNEILTINELFPPLCQRVKIQLNFTDTHRHIKSVKYLNMHSIASDKEHGFLPTFGPAYLYFYCPNDMGEFYAGKVLIAFETRLCKESENVGKGVTRDIIAALDESLLWKYEEVILFASIFDVTMINKKYTEKLISFEMLFGNPFSLKGKDDHTEGNPIISTAGKKPISKTKQFWYLPLNFEKPCLKMAAYHPDLRRRLYNSNLISKVVEALKFRLDEIEKLFVVEEFKIDSSDIEIKLMDLFDYLSAACRKYIDIVSPNAENFVTNLDKEKTNMCLREMEDIEVLAKTVYNPRLKKKCFRKAQKMYKRLELLIEHPQACWPDIFIWLKYGGKKIACEKIEAKDIVFSFVDEERGQYCQRLHNIFFKTIKKQKYTSPIACKLTVWLWMGLERHRQHCLQTLPSGYKKQTVTGMPELLIGEEVHKFQCRAHIYQGRFHQAFDDTGLSDLYCRVSIDEQCHSTKVKKNTLNPIWDQVLVFKYLTIFGIRIQIKEHPPIVVFEITDQDKCCQTEFVGRGTLKPVVKLLDEEYLPPDFPPKLKWVDIKHDTGIAGQVLAAVELLELGDNVIEVEDTKDPRTIVPIPDDIKPVLVSYRLEVFFWGVRLLKKVDLLPIVRPKISLECSGERVQSETLISARKDLNFHQPIKGIDIMLSSQEEFIPPLTIKMYEVRSFGRNLYIGTCLTYSQQFMYHPITDQEFNRRVCGLGIQSYDSLDSQQESRVKLVEPLEPLESLEPLEPLEPNETVDLSAAGDGNTILIADEVKEEEKPVVPVSKTSSIEIETPEDISDLPTDWWAKYYASTENPGKDVRKNVRPNFKLKIYNSELEKQPEFEKFCDAFHTFGIYKGKRSGDETVDQYFRKAILKCAIKIYRWPPPAGITYVTPLGRPLGNDPNTGYFQHHPGNEPRPFQLRVYCVRGLKLRPLDRSGKCDAYICINMGDLKVVKDAKAYVSKQTSPTFGKCYEMKGTFPKDSRITIQVWDWDRNTKNDLIGETEIDIENRFYSKHRAYCGLQYEYTEDATKHCFWRDQIPPTKILVDKCSACNLPAPVFTENTVQVGCKVFMNPQLTSGEMISKESLALHALHHWHELPVIGYHLVPEHVETRSLFHPAKPGLEQGKLQLWLDIFPLGDNPPPKPVDITPRKPQPHELRVVIYNTEDVLLKDDDFFLGEKKSDIYVKAWLSQAALSQSTDVHYRSLTGEGNFNWRFIFPFDYLPSENKIVLVRKEHIFAIDETEVKLPCKLKIQIWDNDTFSADDFIGFLTMDLNRLFRGAKASNKCSLKLTESNAPIMNLFKVKKTKGWWPFKTINKLTNLPVLAGKLEAEFHLLTAEEATANPAGLAREDPQGLAPPNRPNTSFAWFKNPCKSCRFILCRYYKWKILIAVLILLITTFVLMMLYAFPGYSVKKFLHV